MTTTGLSVSDVMSTPVVVLRDHDSIWYALERFTATGLRHLVLLDDRGALVGVVEDRFALAEWPMEAVTQVRRTIGQLMHETNTSPLSCPRIGCAAPVEEAGRVMLSEGVDALPVVNDDGTVVGIVTGSDVLRSLLVTSRESSKESPRGSEISET